MHSWSKMLLLTVLAVFFLFYPGQNVYTVALREETPEPPRSALPHVPAPAPYPENRTGVYPGPEISAEGVVVLDVASGVYLYKRNAEERLAPASTTKIMTALVALEHYNLDDVVTVNNIANDGQVMGLFPGERMTVENLLYGALIYSGNDAARALADHFPGGEPAFVTAMNLKAKELHLTDTHFTNPVGYDNPEHKTTPLDLARLSAYALTNKTITTMVAIPEITVPDVTHTYYHALKNVNELLGKIPGVAGIKTGWTEEAGENLVTLVDRGGHQVIFVVLHSQDRFGDTTKLIDWVFGNYAWQIYGTGE